MRQLVQLVAAAGLLLPTAASAEAVEITGEFPARYREASMLGSIAVERISGQDGHALELALERALAGTHFDLLAGRTGRANAEGGLSGTVTTGVQETPFKKTEKKCTERDDKKKCTKEENVEVRCRRRVINVNADLRLVHNEDGRVLYSAGKPWRDETSWCDGQNPYRTVEEAVSAGIQGMATDVRFDIAPYVETYRIRFRESTKGMPKDAVKPFKAVVKQTQRDLRGACAAWEAMAASMPGNASITFDLGLCAEARGDYDKALRLYQEAGRLIGGDGDEARVGAERAQRLIAGREDAAARTRRR